MFTNLNILYIHLTRAEPGVPGVTQCAICPGEAFVYEFTLDSPGTLWLHSHSGLQRTSVHGAIVISGDEHHLPTYEEERTLVLNDWFHEDIYSELDGLLNPRFRWINPSIEDYE